MRLQASSTAVVIGGRATAELVGTDSSAVHNRMSSWPSQSSQGELLANRDQGLEQGRVRHRQPGHLRCRASHARVLKGGLAFPTEAIIAIARTRL
jgi:hypothetical protein